VQTTSVSKVRTTPQLLPGICRWGECRRAPSSRGFERGEKQRRSNKSSLARAARSIAVSTGPPRLAASQTAKGMYPSRPMQAFYAENKKAHPRRMRLRSGALSTHLSPMGRTSLSLAEFFSCLDGPPQPSSAWVWAWWVVGGAPPPQVLRWLRAMFARRVRRGRYSPAA
jgi:hypothetical protein